MVSAQISIWEHFNSIWLVMPTKEAELDTKEVNQTQDNGDLYCNTAVTTKTETMDNVCRVTF